MRRLSTIIATVGVALSFLIIPVNASETPKPKDLYAGLAKAEAYVEISNYLTGLAEADAFNAWVASTNAFLATLTPPPPPVQNAPVVRNTGPHSDAWWHGVAICEQGGRNDPYFGYFSFMDGSMGGQPWDVQVAAGNALLMRVGHEIGPWAASCVAAGYAASPSG